MMVKRTHTLIIVKSRAQSSKCYSCLVFVCCTVEILEDNTFTCCIVKSLLCMYNLRVNRVFTSLQCLLLLFQKFWCTTFHMDMYRFDLHNNEGVSKTPFHTCMKRCAPGLVLKQEKMHLGNGILFCSETVYQCQQVFG